MSEEPESWEEAINTDRSNPVDYVLNGKDRMYCVTGNAEGSYKKSELKSRISEDRLQKLPQRFQDLFDDISLVEYSDIEFLTESDKEKIWEELIDTERRASNTLGFHIRSAEPPTPVYNFGVELGAVIRAIKQTDKPETADLVWGFAVGLNASPREEFEIEEDRMDDLTSRLDKKSAHRASFFRRKSKKREINSQIYSETESKIIDALSEKGVDVGKLSVNTGDISIILKLSSLPPDREEIDEKIRELIDLHQLKRMIKLQRYVEEDGETVLNETWRGEKAKLIINELWLLHQVDPSKTKSVNKLTSVSYHDTAMKLINQYSTKQEGDSSIQYPIIEKSNQGCKLTEYGKLISYCIFENGQNYDWIQKYGMFNMGLNELPRSAQISEEERSLIKNALGEITLEALP
jgi:hypothetical protein